MIVAFVDEHRGEFGVEFICRHLQVAPSTYYAAKRREAEPSARAKRDAALMPILLALWVANRKVYGAHKLWKAAQRAGNEIGRDQVGRLMRELEIRGVSRMRQKVFTTRQDPDAWRAAWSYRWRSAFGDSGMRDSFSSPGRLLPGTIGAIGPQAKDRPSSRGPDGSYALRHLHGAVPPGG